MKSILLSFLYIYAFSTFSNAKSHRHDRHTHQVKQVASLLNDISVKLSVERTKEAAVFDDLKKICNTPVAVSAKQDAKPISAASAKSKGTAKSSLKNGNNSAAKPLKPGQVAAKKAPKKAPQQLTSSAGSSADSSSATSATDDTMVAMLKARHLRHQHFLEQEASMMGDQGGTASKEEKSEHSKSSDDDAAATPEVSSSDADVVTASTKTTDAQAGKDKNADESSEKDDVPDVSDSSLDKDDPTEDIDRMNSLLDSADGRDSGVPAKKTSDKKVEPKLKAVKTHVPQAAPKPVPLPAKTKPAADDDNAAVDQLANVVNDAITSAEPSELLVTSTAAPAKASVGGYEPLASAVLAIDDTAVEETSGFSAPSETSSQPQGKLLLKAVPERPPSKPVEAAVEAVQSEFDTTATELADAEKDLTPEESASVDDVSLVQKSRQKAAIRTQKSSASLSEKPKTLLKEEANVVSMTKAFDDMFGGIPGINDQASQMYKSFGGEQQSPGTSDSMSFLSGASFLQVAKHRLHKLKKLAPALHHDLDAALAALEDVATETKSAMSLLESLRDSDDSSDADSESTADTSQCASVRQKLEKKANSSAKHEASLRLRSQQLLDSLHTNHAES